MIGCSVSGHDITKISKIVFGPHGLSLITVLGQILEAITSSFSLRFSTNHIPCNKVSQSKNLGQPTKTYGTEVSVWPNLLASDRAIMVSS